MGDAGGAMGAGGDRAVTAVGTVGTVRAVRTVRALVTGAVLVVGSTGWAASAEAALVVGETGWAASAHAVSVRSAHGRAPAVGASLPGAAVPSARIVGGGVATGRDTVPEPFPRAGGWGVRPVDSEIDTTVAVRRGERLVLRVPEGSVRIATGAGAVVRIVGGSDPEEWRRRSLPRIGRDAEVVEVRLPPERDDWGITVPAWLPVELVGRQVDAELVGLQGGVVARSGDGDIEARELGGVIDLSAVRGEIRVVDAGGELRLRAGDGDVRLERVAGRVTAETTDGDVHMSGMLAETVLATTVDGDVIFGGRLVAGGRYEFGTHDGDVVVALAPDADVRVRAMTYDGDLEPGFPVTIDGFRSGEPTVFILGDGSAELILSSFSGDVRLVRNDGLDDSNQE